VHLLQLNQVETVFALLYNGISKTIANNGSSTFNTSGTGIVRVYVLSTSLTLAPGDIFIRIKYQIGEKYMKFDHKRLLAFLFVFVGYVFATIIGLIIFSYFRDLQYHPILAIFLADIGMTIFIYIIGLFVNNASMYDPYWSVIPMLYGLLYMFGYRDYSITTILINIVIALWSLRLTANWMYTFKTIKKQDWRYDYLKEKSGPFYPVVNLFGIHLIPTLFVFGALLPVLFVFAKAPQFNMLMIVGVVISLLGVLLELVADIQMQRFRNHNNNPRALIRDGLWKYSRHPNYLGEITFWWGLFAIAIVALPSMWYLVFGPIAMTLMFLVISIPMAEQRYARIKDGFSQYVEETRMLFPLPKK
jgi:steroid 5-alpha reductase family enzyme